jgi:ArsR family transcriptional regulator, arsenate/arsenite/antimonite-responsive transcriptional repressor
MKTKPTKGFDMELFFRALGDRTRLRLLNLMGDDEVCVCFLVEALKQTQPKISRHLAFLRRGGLVAARREGKWMHYRLSVPPDPDAQKLLLTIRESLKNHLEMQMDRSRLMRLCCSPAVPAPLKRAPKPKSVASAQA